MTIATVSIPCNFVADLGVGEDLARNARLLCKFVESNGGFQKLIVMQSSSMVESALAQIISRGKNSSREGVPNFSEEDQVGINKGAPYRFNTIINVMKKYHALDSLGSDVYDDLNKLKEYWIAVGRNEPSAHSDGVAHWALGFSARVLTHLSEHFYRPNDLEQCHEVLTMPTAWRGLPAPRRG
jgi:hypothetical protein